MNEKIKQSLLGWLIDVKRTIVERPGLFDHPTEYYGANSDAAKRIIDLGAI